VPGNESPDEDSWWHLNLPMIIPWAAPMAGISRPSGLNALAKLKILLDVDSAFLKHETVLKKQGVD
jgi:hypothetical protein